MNDSKAVLRALKGFLMQKTLANKKTFLWFAYIMLGLIPINIIIMYILYSAGVTNGGSENLITYGQTIGITILMVISISSTTSKTRNMYLRYPIDRKIYTLGNLIFLSGSTVLCMLLTAVAGILEIITLNIIFAASGKVVFLNLITFENFIAGFFVSVSYIIFISALFYCFGSFFFRNKLLTSLFLIAFGLVFVFPQGRSFLFKLLIFFVFESSVVVLCVKLWLSACVLILLGFVPIRKMEVS